MGGWRGGPVLTAHEQWRGDVLRRNKQRAHVLVWNCQKSLPEPCRGATTAGGVEAGAFYSFFKVNLQNDILKIDQYKLLINFKLDNKMF